MCAQHLWRRGGGKTVSFPRWSLNTSFRNINFQLIYHSIWESHPKRQTAMCAQKPPTLVILSFCWCWQHCWAQSSAPRGTEGHGSSSLAYPQTLLHEWDTGNGCFGRMVLRVCATTTGLLYRAKHIKASLPLSSSEATRNSEGRASILHVTTNEADFN